MRAAFWRARLRLRKQRAAAGPDLILRVAGLVFAALVAAVIIVLVRERLHQ